MWLSERQSALTACWGETAAFEGASWRDPAFAVAAAPGALAVADDCVAALDGNTSATALIAAYRSAGDRCAPGIENEYAFVLWDRNRRRLLAGCDPAGGRSLAYRFDGRTLLVGSRPRALWRHPRRWDDVYLAHVLANLWRHPAGLTAFDGVRRLPPGMALLLEDGRIREYRASVLTPARHEPTAEAFWALLDEATAARARLTGPCLALSGGLDSALVGASLARHAPAFHALTWRADVVGREVAAFQAHFPGVTVHEVKEDEEVAGDPDDPMVAGHPFRGSHRALLRRARALGFPGVLDGEGGDELFSMNRHLGDFVRRGAWWDLARVLVAHPTRRSLVARGLVVPRLPPLAARAWSRREARRRERLLPWLTPAFWRAAATREALAQAEVRGDSSLAATAAVLGHPVTVGGRSERRATAAELGLELCSPLLDRRLIGFATGLPPALHWLPPGSKPFLHRVAATRLPSSLADKPKDLGLYRALRQRTFTAGAAGIVASCEPIARHVDGPVLADWLARAHRGDPVPERLADALHALVTTARWMNAVCSSP